MPTRKPAHSVSVARALLQIQYEKDYVSAVARENSFGLAVVTSSITDGEYKTWAEQFLKKLEGTPEGRAILEKLPGNSPAVFVPVFWNLSKILDDLKRPSHKRRNPGVREEKFALVKERAAIVYKVVQKATKLADDLELVSRFLFLRSIPLEVLEDIASRAQQAEVGPFAERKRQPIAGGQASSQIPGVHITDLRRKIEDVQQITPPEALALVRFPEELRTAARVLKSKVLPKFQKRGSFKQYGTDDCLVAFLHCYFAGTANRPHHQEIADLLNIALSLPAELQWSAKDVGTKIERFRKGDPSAFELIEQFVSRMTKL